MRGHQYTTEGMAITAEVDGLWAAFSNLCHSFLPFQVKWNPFFQSALPLTPDLACGWLARLMEDCAIICRMFDEREQQAMAEVEVIDGQEVERRGLPAPSDAQAGTTTGSASDGGVGPLPPDQQRVENDKVRTLKDFLFVLNDCLQRLDEANEIEAFRKNWHTPQADSGQRARDLCRVWDRFSFARPAAPHGDLSFAYEWAHVDSIRAGVCQAIVEDDDKESRSGAEGGIEPEPRLPRPEAADGLDPGAISPLKRDAAARAWEAFEQICMRNPDLTRSTDKEIHAAIEKDPVDGYHLPSLATFCTYLTKERGKRNMRKNRPSLPPSPNGKSIVRHDQVDWDREEPDRT